VDPRTEEAHKALHIVKRKLEGFRRPSYDRHQSSRNPTAAAEVPLSTTNLVDSLIRDATSSRNLALMCAFIDITAGIETC
jgi:hypothetical protein